LYIGTYEGIFKSMGILINWLLSALVILSAAYVLPGVKIEGFFTALVVALILGVVNAVLKPILVILTLPINILTLGLFTLVINALLIMLTSSLVPGFRVESFWWALLFGILLSVINAFLDKISH
jgi:putative membrane protein